VSKDQFSDLCYSVSSKFPISYFVYKYYRSVGWVPKNGLKFGGDFVLYRVGPEHYHSQYALLYSISQRV
jgi:tRNA-intron lyase